MRDAVIVFPGFLAEKSGKDAKSYIVKKAAGV